MCKPLASEIDLLDDFLARLDEAGIARAIVHSAATAPGQVIPANNWAIHVQNTNQQLLAFGTLHPDFTNWEAELDRLERNGIKGLKLHPDFQGFWLNDPRLQPIYEALQGRFTVMCHIGDRVPPEQNPSSPAKLARIKKDFPGLKVIAAHFGGFQHWDYVLEHLAETDVYVDTSSSLDFISDEQLQSIYHALGRERILFGSDYPLSTPTREIRLLRQRLQLSDAELEEILTNGNALFSD